MPVLANMDVYDVYRQYNAKFCEIVCFETVADVSIRNLKFSFYLKFQRKNQKVGAK